MKDTLRPLYEAWSANIGRPPTDGEAAEFGYRYHDSDPKVLRRAIDVYFATCPRFATLPELHDTYRRLALPPDSGDATDLASAFRWLKGSAIERYGFKCGRSWTAAEDAMAAWRLLVRWQRASDDGLMVHTGEQARADVLTIEDQLDAIGIHRREAS